MRVLVACEFSGRVRDAFLAKGHEAYSCDIRANSHPNHIRGYVEKYLLDPWDLVIAHPPCTYLCNSGVRWLERNVERMLQVVDGAKLFNACLNANAPKVCVENPIMHKYAKKYITTPHTQIIQPWMFGEQKQKSTCLWLKGLPELVATNVVGSGSCYVSPKGKILPGWYSQAWGKGHGSTRSVTFSGIAEAMAEQWG